jgi:hypothetical protein
VQKLFIRYWTIIAISIAQTEQLLKSFINWCKGKFVFNSFLEFYFIYLYFDFEEGFGREV